MKGAIIIQEGPIYFEDAAEEVYGEFLRKQCQTVGVLFYETHKETVEAMQQWMRAPQHHMRGLDDMEYTRIAWQALQGYAEIKNLEYDEAVNRCLELLIRKQRDYGPKNILKFGHIGLLVRMTDKIERLANLAGNKSNPAFEALEDTYMDIFNYCMIGFMLRRDYFGLPLKGDE